MTEESSQPHTSLGDLVVSCAAVGSSLGLLAAIGTFDPYHDYLFALPTPLAGRPIAWVLATASDLGLRISPPQAATLLGLLVGFFGGSIAGAVASLSGIGRWPRLSSTLAIALAAVPLCMAVVVAVWTRRDIEAGVLLYVGILVFFAVVVPILSLLLAAVIRSVSKLALPVAAALVLVVVGALAIASTWPGIERREAEIAATKAPRPVLLLGVDAASWANLQEDLAAGRLPQFEAMRERGAYGELQSTSPTWSPVIWTTIVTGRGADRHGIHDFTLDGVPYSSNSRTDWALWEILPLFAQRSAFHYWWASWPAEEIDGRVVTDRFQQRELGRRIHPVSDLSHLDALADQAATQAPSLDSVLGPGDLDDLRTRHREKIEVLSDFLLRDEISTVLGEEAIRSGQFDLVGVYLRGIDAVGHKFYRWHYQDRAPAFAELMYRDPGPDQGQLAPVIVRMHELSDGWLGRLVAATNGEWNIVVVSDHGMSAAGNPNPDEVEPETGHHHISGLFLMAGPDIREGRFIRGASIFDVFPTILYLLDLPVPADLGGSVITHAIRPELLEERPLKVVSRFGERAVVDTKPISTGEDEEYLDALRALGYIVD